MRIWVKNRKRKKITFQSNIAYSVVAVVLRYEGQWLGDMQHGVGIVRKSAGGRFEGRFDRGQRSGNGVETWGNVQKRLFVCPMGHQHEGRGFCMYAGLLIDKHLFVFNDNSDG